MNKQMMICCNYFGRNADMSVNTNDIREVNFSGTPEKAVSMWKEARSNHDLAKYTPLKVYDIKYK